MRPSGAISARSSAPPPTGGDAASRPWSRSSDAPRPGTGSDLDPAGHGPGDLGDGIDDGHAVLLLAVTVAERDRAGRHVVVAGQQHVGHLLALRVADLLLHTVIAGVDL